MEEKELSLGVVGVGHWFDRLNQGIKKVGGVTLEKATGTRSFEEKEELLSKFGVTKEKYYIADKSGLIPEGFFDNVDIVHIADPNKFHSSQTLAALERGKFAIVEKTLGINEKEFKDTVSYIRKNGLESKTYLHLHYIHKQPSLKFKELLPELVAEHGKITKIYSTFFEKENEEDARRTWLFSLEHGGIFMDWIHPFEVVAYTTGASFETKEISPYCVKAEYDQVNPTGIEAVSRLKGNYFSKDAEMITRVAKGVKEGQQNKFIKIEFESGHKLKLNFKESKEEFESGERGSLELSNGSGPVKITKLYGETPSEIFVKEIINMTKGNPQEPNLKILEKIFEPQWEYQQIINSKQLVTDKDLVSHFVTNGINAT